MISYKHTYIPVLVVDIGGLVVGNGNTARLDSPEILQEEFVVPLDFVGGFPANSFGHILPPVRGVLIVQG